MPPRPKKLPAMTEIEREDRISRALLRVEQGLSYRQAAKEIGVSFGTIYGRFRGRKSRVKAQEARMKLTFLEEIIIEKMLLTALYLGKPYTQTYFVQAVNSFLQAQGESNPEKITRQWYRHFRRRHPSMDAREFSILHNPSHTQYVEDVIESWFKKFLAVCNSYNISIANTYCIEEFGYVPGQAFPNTQSLSTDTTKQTNKTDHLNIDPTLSPFSHSHSGNEIIQNKNLNSFFSAGATTERLLDAEGQVIIPPPPPNTFTFIETISADNCILPPYVVYQNSSNFDPKLLIHSNLSSKKPLSSSFNYNSFRFGSTKTGWLDSTLIMDWIQNHFDPLTRTKAAGGYRLILLDTNAIHFSIKFLEYGIKNKIIFLFLPPLNYKLSPFSHQSLLPLKSDIYKVPTQSDINLTSFNHFRPTSSNFFDAINEIRQQVLSATAIAFLWECSGLVSYNPSIILATLKIPPENQGDELLASDLPSFSRLYVTYLPIKDLDVDISILVEGGHPTKCINTPTLPPSVSSNFDTFWKSEISKGSGENCDSGSNLLLPVSSPSVTVASVSKSTTSTDIINLTSQGSASHPCSFSSFYSDSIKNSPATSERSDSFSSITDSSFTFRNLNQSSCTRTLSPVSSQTTISPGSFQNHWSFSDFDLFSSSLQLMSEDSNNKTPLTVFELAADSAAKNKAFNEMQLRRQKEIIEMISGIKSSLKNLSQLVHSIDETTENKICTQTAEKFNSNSGGNMKTKEDCISIIENLQKDLAKVVNYPEMDIDQFKAASRSNELVEKFLREQVRRASTGKLKHECLPSSVHPNASRNHGFPGFFSKPSSNNNGEFLSPILQAESQRQETGLYENKYSPHRSMSLSSAKNINDLALNSQTWTSGSFQGSQSTGHYNSDSKKNPMSIDNINNSPLPSIVSVRHYHNSSSPTSKYRQFPNSRHPPRDYGNPRNPSLNVLPPLGSVTSKSFGPDYSYSPNESLYLPSSAVIGNSFQNRKMSSPSFLPPLYGSQSIDPADEKASQSTQQISQFLDQVGPKNFK